MLSGSHEQANKLVVKDAGKHTNDMASTARKGNATKQSTNGGRAG